MQKKSATPAHLAHRRVNGIPSGGIDTGGHACRLANVPDESFQFVLSSGERKANALNGPMLNVAAVRAECYLAGVATKLKALIAGDVEQQRFLVDKREAKTETQNSGFRWQFVGMPNPGSCFGGMLSDGIGVSQMTGRREKDPGRKSRHIFDRDVSIVNRDLIGGLQKLYEATS
jgi:hypothetical protein